MALPLLLSHELIYKIMKNATTIILGFIYIKVIAMTHDVPEMAITMFFYSLYDQIFCALATASDNSKSLHAA